MKKFLLSILCCLMTVFAVQAQSYVKVTETPSDWSGDYLIVYEADGLAFNGGLETLDAVSNTIAVTIADNAIEATDAVNAAKFTINASGHILSASGYYIGQTSNANGLKSNTSTTYTNTLSLNADGSVNVVSASAYLRYNAASDQLRFRYFKSSTYSKQKAIALYKYTETTAGGGDIEDPDTPVDVAEPTFTPVDGTAFDESLDVTINVEDGLTAYYSTDGGNTYTEGTNVNITENTTITAYAQDAEGNKSDEVSATYTKNAPVDPNAMTAEFVAKDAGYENGFAVESLTFGDVTATFDKGTNSNAPKYYTTGYAIRAYGGNTITFTGAVGVTITKIELTFASGEGSNAITADCGNFSTDTWTGDASKIVFSVDGASGHRRIATIKVTYSIDENVVVIATPSITAAESFVGSTTVEITNNEVGTTLYYSTNGVDYVAYEEPFTIVETTTITAYAQDAQGNKSSVANATYTKIEILSIAEAKAAYDDAGANVAVAVDLTDAVVTVNSGMYLFIENATTGINIYNSGADYAVGTKFTKGYILGESAAYGKMHQITSAVFKDVETTTVTVEPTEVTIANLVGNNAEYEGRFVKLTGVSVDVANKTITQGEDTYALYNRFSLELSNAAMCDIEGVVAIYNTTEQLYITKVSPYYTLTVTEAGWATLYLGFNARIPSSVEAYTVTAVNEGWVSLTKVTGVLPSNQGVIIKAAAGNYDFYNEATATADVTDNLLKGSTVSEVVTPAGTAYVLGINEGIVGLYKAELDENDGTAFLNNANKAYLVVPAASQAIQYFSFDFGGGTTGIEGVEAEGAVSDRIYDITGREVKSIASPGIYIVNGKKVLVK